MCLPRPGVFLLTTDKEEQAELLEKTTAASPDTAQRPGQYEGTRNSNMNGVIIRLLWTCLCLSPVARCWPKVRWVLNIITESKLHEQHCGVITAAPASGLITNLRDVVDKDMTPMPDTPRVRGSGVTFAGWKPHSLRNGRFQWDSTAGFFKAASLPLFHVNWRN